MINHSRRLPPQAISTRVLAAAVSIFQLFGHPKQLNRFTPSMVLPNSTSPGLAGVFFLLMCLIKLCRRVCARRPFLHFNARHGVIAIALL
jgi:hypothetical protein